MLPKLQQEYTPGLYFRLVIPKGTYAGVNYDSGSVGVANALVRLGPQAAITDSGVFSSCETLATKS